MVQSKIITAICLLLLPFLGLAQTNNEVKEISKTAITNGAGIQIVSGQISVVDNQTEQKIRVYKAGSIGGIRRSINFIEGSNVTITPVDNVGSDRIDVTIALTGVQATLVSGTNIKTINGNSLLGSGDITISGGGSLPTQTGNATKFLTTDGTNASWAYSVYPFDYAARDSVSTTNATPTTLHTVTLNTASRGIIEVRLVGYDYTNDKALTCVKRVRYKKSSGGVLTLGTVEDETALEYDGALTTATFNIINSADNAVVQVTGEAATNITWKATILVTNYSAPL